MVRKKNKMFVDSADRTPHYSLRKLSVGVASVLLSTTLWMGANGSVAHADTINDATVAGKVEDKLDPSETHKDQTQAQNGQGQDAASVVTGANQTKNKEGSSANAEAQTPTANDAHAQADVAKQEPAAQSQQTAPQAQVPAPAERRQASTAEQAAGQASAAATENAKNESTTTLGVSQAFKPSTVAALNKKMVMASLAGTASAGSESKSDDLKSYETTIASLTNRAAQDELNVTLEDPKTYTIKKEALDDLDKQVAGIQGKVTKYEADKAAYDAAKKVYDEDLKKWSDAQNPNDPHMVKGISQGLSFTNETDASLDVTSGSDKPVHFIKSSAWLGSDGQGVYTDGMTNGGNISKSFINSDISDSQAKGTALDGKHWGKTYTGVQLNKHESVVASYTGLKNSVYIDKDGVAHKLGKVQVKYTLNETTAKDGTANIFLSNNPNIALWYGAAGDGVARDQSSGRVDLTVDLTFYDENGNPITLGQGSNAWLDMSSLNNGTTKVEYFAPDGNTTMQIPGSTIQSHTNGDWYADSNNEDSKVNPTGWDNPASADRYYGAAIMELEGHSFHIGQEITKYNPRLTNSRNVYSWFALDSSLATAYKPVKPTEPEPPTIVWHGVTYEPQKATVTYIDDTDNKRILSSESLEGDSKSVAVVSKDGTPYTTTSSIQDYENKGYELVSDSTHGDNVVFDNDSSVDQRYEVHLKHGTVTVTPYDKTPVKPGDKINPNDPNSPKYKDDVKHDNLVKDAKQTVHYEGAGTDTPADSVTTQKNAFTRTVKYDKVTGESTTSDWSQPNTTFDKVDTPVVKGYTADKKQAGGLTATPDDPEVKDTVVYTPNGSIVPVDPNGNPIPNTPSVPYETDPHDPTKVVNGKVPEVPSWTPKTGKPGDPVVPTNPTQNTKVPYDHTKTTSDTTVPGKQTVTYVYKDKDGKVVNTKTKTVEQDTAFTGKTTKDEFTGKTTTTWDQKDHKYTAVKTPVEPGYTADQESVGGDTVTPDDPNRSYEVVYTPNGSIVPVDPNGNPIPNTPSVPYETDPHDPTKVVNGKVPEVPSWTPKTGKPGDPVKPSDPSKDTKVPYVHTKVVDGKVPEVPSWTPKNGNQGDPVKPSDPSKDTEVPDNHTKVVDGKVPEVPSWTPKNGKPGDPVVPTDPSKDTKVPYDHTITPGKTTATGKVEGLPEKPAKSAKAPAEKLVKTPVKAPKAVKEAAPAEMPAQKVAQAQDQLPQTGEDNSKAAFGLGLASILGGIGILGAFKRKKKEN